MNESTIHPESTRGRGWLVAIALLVVIVLVAGGLYLAMRPVPEQIQGMVDTRPINISTKLPSRVSQLLVQEGEAVHAGQPLVILSSPELDAKTQQAQGLLTGAEALRQRTITGTRSEDIASLKAALDGALAGATLADETARRMVNLYNEGVVAAQRRDEAVAAREVAEQHVDLARAQYKRGLAGPREEDRIVAGSQVQVAQAGVEEAQSLQHETRLLAPVDGEIDQRFANPGELVVSGVPIFSLLDFHDLWVAINLREDQFHGLTLGQQFRGAVPALDRKDVLFKVNMIRPQADFATWRATRQSGGYDVRSFEVHLQPVEPLQGLRPGMSVLFDWPAHR